MKNGIKKIRDGIILGSTALYLVLLALPVAAQQAVPAATPGNSDQPIEITAGRTLEWHRNDNKYIGRGDVVVTQGDVSVYSQTLTADYRDGAQSSMEIWQLTAEQDVRIQNTTTTAYGDKAVYDVDKAYAVLTGDNLKMVSPDQTVTARDRLEYWTDKGEALAVGDAKVVRTEDTLTADTIKAVFAETPEGRKIDTLHAVGNVVIVTPQETLYGDKGVYKASTDTAELIGHVRILREKNQLEGERAEVNLTTNISKIFGGAAGAGGDGRVRGIFYPGSDKKPDQDKNNPSPKTQTAPPVTGQAPSSAPAPAPLPPAGGATLSSTKSQTP